MKSILNAIFSWKRTLIFGLIAALAVTGIWAGNRWIGRKVQSSLVSQLHRHGLELQWQQSFWDPWRGLQLRGLTLRRVGGDPSIVAELGNLDLGISITNLVGGDRTTSWRVHNAVATLHDSKGAVKFDQVSLHLDAQDGRLEVRSLKMSKAGVTATLTGDILLSANSLETSEPIHLNLDAIRATLTTLDFRADSGRFKVEGNFKFDATKPLIDWSSRLTCHGDEVEWKGVRCIKATARAEISSLVSEIHYELTTAHGSVAGIASKKDWSDSPFVFEGTLRDSGGQADEYRGNYQKHVLTVETLKGSADLWALASDIPSIGERRPDKVRFKKFPQIHLRNARRDAAKEEPRWTVEFLTIDSKDTVAFTSRGRDMEARGLSARGSFDGRDWIIDGASAGMLGGSVSLNGRYREGILRKARLKLEDVRLSELKQLSGKGGGRETAGVVTARFGGSIDLPKKQLEGDGSVRVGNAPVVEVPLLDQAYDLFSAILPGVERSGKGELNAEFHARPDIIEVTKFEAKGGSSLTVSAIGTVDLKKGRVNGHARGKLVGLPGLVTSPLSRLLEMEVSGPYDDIRVRPLGPAKLASNTASGTVGVAVDTLQETGKITGTLLKEGLKVPFGWLDKDGKGQPPEDKSKR